MDEQFEILLQYVNAKKEKEKEEEEGRKKMMESKLEGGEEEKEEEDRSMSSSNERIECLHAGQVVHEGYHVCTACGLVLDPVFEAEVDWETRCVKPRSYTGTDRLQAVDRHLVDFMSKTGVTVPIHPVQERLRFMKKEGGFKSINYAIALTCILADDDTSVEKLKPFLPRSNVSWARSMRLLDPVSNAFVYAWYRHMRQGVNRPLSLSQCKRLNRNFALLEERQTEVMYRLIRCYGCYGYDLPSLPMPLRSILYKFTCAVLKHG